MGCLCIWDNIYTRCFHTIHRLNVNPTDVKRDPLPWEMTMHWCQPTNTQSQALYPVRLVYGGEKENERRSNIHGNHV